MFSFSQVVTGKENKAPADRFRYERTKVQTLAAQATKDPARKAFGVTNKVDVRGGTLIGRQNACCPSATSGKQPKLNQNTALTKTYTIVSSKSHLNAGSHLKKQPNTGIQSSVRASSNAARTAVTKLNNRFSTSSNSAWLCPMKSVNFRMSLGPIVKTKTGLTPAVTQPRNIQSQNQTRAGATTTNTSVAKKVRSSTLPPASVSHKSAMAQRKTLPSTVLNNPVNERPTVSLTARAGIKVRDQNKFNSKPILGKHYQPSCKSQPSNGLKSSSTSSKCTAAPIKPEGRVERSKTNKPAGQPADRSTKQRSEGEVEKNGQRCTSRMSSRPATRCSTRTASGDMRSAVAHLGGKTKTCAETDSKRGHSSANAPPLQYGIKRTGAPVMSQTVPRPARTISLTGQATDMKSPKVPVRVIPQTEGKKLTAVQEERM